jgi:hypothetical protein
MSRSVEFDSEQLSEYMWRRNGAVQRGEFAQKIEPLSFQTRWHINEHMESWLMH